MKKNIIIIDLDEEENYEYYDPIYLSNHVLDLCDNDKMNYVFIDLLATKGTRMYYIQVASDISNEETRNRELKPYISLNDQIQKIIVINRPINETRDIDGFTVIGIVDFLLRFIK